MGLHPLQHQTLLEEKGPLGVLEMLQRSCCCHLIHHLILTPEPVL
jgi:hypothetical protein